MVCLLREGWEQSNDRLYALDRAAADARYTRLAKELAQHPPHALAIEHVRLFDSPSATMREDQTVVFNGDHIASVGSANSIRIPDDAQRDGWSRENPAARPLRYARARAGGRRTAEYRERRDLNSR